MSKKRNEDDVNDDTDDNLEVMKKLKILKMMKKEENMMKLKMEMLLFTRVLLVHFEKRHCHLKYDKFSKRNA